MTETSGDVLGPTAIRILTIARQLFMQRGYRAVSISDIVGAAEITKPTLYYHFADKEELFVQVVLHMLAEMRVRMDAAIASQSSTAGKLTAVVRMLMEMPDLDSRMVRHEAREQLSPQQQQRTGLAFHRQMFEPLRDLMTLGLERGELVGRSADELAVLFLCVIEGFHYQNDSRSHAGDTRPDSAFAMTFPPETIVQFFLHGVGRS